MDSWGQYAATFVTIATWMAPRLIAYIPVSGTEEEIRRTRQGYLSQAAALIGIVAALIAAGFDFNAMDWDTVLWLLGAGFVGKTGGDAAYNAYWKAKQVNRDFPEGGHDDAAGALDQARMMRDGSTFDPDIEAGWLHELHQAREDAGHGGD